MKNINVSFLLIILFLAVMPLTSQGQTTFTGKIIDSETKEPIPLVTIRSSTVYTITNINGDFDIFTRQADKQISISHISYHSQQIDSDKIPEIIELKPKTFELAEVNITPRETIVKELKKVWDKYMALTKEKKDKDFPESTFYYRQLMSINDLYIEYIEYFFTAPTTVSVQNMSLQEGRFARIKKRFSSVFYQLFLFFSNSSFQP